MTVLHHLAQAAAVILLIELLVVLFLFLGIAGGLAFGLHWVRGKTGWAFEKADGALRMIGTSAHTATDYAAKPVIMGAGLTARIRALATSLQRQARVQRGPAAAESVPPATETQVTTVMPRVPDAPPGP